MSENFLATFLCNEKLIVLTAFRFQKKKNIFKKPKSGFFLQRSRGNVTFLPISRT